jgi:sec-independent protein translocase protein TatA
VAGVLSPWHIAILVLVLLLVFGPKRLPEMGRSLGKGMRELKDGITRDDPAESEPQRAPLPAAKSGPRENDSI